MPFEVFSVINYNSCCGRKYMREMNRSLQLFVKEAFDARINFYCFGIVHHSTGTHFPREPISCVPYTQIGLTSNVSSVHLFILTYGFLSLSPIKHGPIRGDYNVDGSGNGFKLNWNLLLSATH